jgi:hypothetical protein
MDSRRSLKVMSSRHVTEVRAERWQQSCEITFISQRSFKIVEVQR